MLAVLLIINAYGQDVVIVTVGQSNALGYDKPLPCKNVTPRDPACDDLPPNTRYIRNGQEQLEFDPLRSGIEVGLLTCLSSIGYSATYVVRAVNGIMMSSIINTQMPLLLGDMDTYSLSPSVVIVIHGEADSRDWGTTMGYFAKLAGPAYEDTGPTGYTDPSTGIWTKPYDKSVFGQIRNRWPGVPFIIPEMRTRDNRDLSNWYLGDVVNGAGAPTYPHHVMMRASQAWGCARTPGCFLIETPQYDTMPGSDLHYSAQGYWDLGWDTCAVVDQWVMQSFPPVP